MNKIEVSVRLRPVRFAFLIRPNDKSGLQKIFEINTCLWGGMYNPIIPYFERIPSWWSRDGRHFQKARQIVEGYLDFFEPDFIIEAEEGLGKKLDLPDDVIVNADRFRFDESYPSYEEVRGLSVFHIYRELYQKEFKFVRRRKHGIIFVQPKDDRFNLFASCFFGNFPHKKSLVYFKRGYQDIFRPVPIALDSSQLKGIYSKPYGSPLHIGSENIDVFYSDRTDPMVYILDATQPRDLIDLWNLRTFKKEILAIPVQWFEALSQFCRELAVKNHRPLPGNQHGVMIHTTFLFSRSLTKERIATIQASLRVEQKGVVSFQTWYPNIWDKKSDMILSPNRAVLTAGESTQEATVDDNGSFKFNNLSPNFIDRHTYSSSWANVIHLKEGIDKNQIATVFPPSLRNPSFPNLSFDNKRILSNTEGLITYQTPKNWPEYWNYLNGTSAFVKWFETQNVNTRISPAGKTLLQVMQSFQGFWGLAYISHPKIIDRLNSMACKLSKNTEGFGNQQKEYFGRTVKFTALKEEIHKIHNDAIAAEPWKKQVLQSLIKYNVIKLGLEVKCPTCDHRNWYSLGSLSYELVCENCLKRFSFPQASPSNQIVNWSYRVIGPFAKPDYAQGAYASALALRFFSHLDHGYSSSLTWCTSLELTLDSGQQSEVDFLLWYQRRRIIENNYGVQMVFGESKSFAKDSFTEKDLKTLRNLAERFPGSVLVCATMKDILDANEKRAIARAAIWGRAITSSGITRAPLIVLTGTELFSQPPFFFKHVWKQKGGKRAELVGAAYLREDNLRVLADITALSKKTTFSLAL